MSEAVVEANERFLMKSVDPGSTVSSTGLIADFEVEATAEVDEGGAAVPFQIPIGAFSR